MPIGAGTVDQGQAGTDPWLVAIGAIALPTGAATEAKQDVGNASLASIDGKITAVDTGAVVVASSALPTGAAAEHVTAASPHATRLSDGAAFYDATKTGQLPAALVGGRLDVNVGNAVTISGTVPVSGTIAATQSGAWSITDITGTIALPTGAATSALQTTGNTSLASIDTKTPALVGGRQPVDGSGVTQPISGTVAVSNFPATQPVSGTVTASQGGAWTVAATQSGTWTITNVSGTVSLPTGASTAAKQPALGVAGTASADVLTVQGIAGMTPVAVSGTLTTTPPAHASTNVTQWAGTAVDTNSGVTSAGTLRVVLATDQPQLTAAFKVDGSAVTQPVSAASLPLPTGAATEAKQPTLGTAGTPSADVLTVQGAAGMTALKVDGSGVTQPVSGTVAISGTVPATQSGTWNIGTVTTVSAVTSITNTVTTKEVRSATPTQASVADSATSVTLLASNANRLGATVANDSSAALLLKLGATASATSYTARLVQYGYYEVPYGYTGVVDGIWSSDPGDGAARVTELTA